MCWTLILEEAKVIPKLSVPCEVVDVPSPVCCCLNFLHLRSALAFAEVYAPSAAPDLRSVCDFKSLTGKNDT